MANVDRKREGAPKEGTRIRTWMHSENIVRVDRSKTATAGRDF